MHAVQNRLNYQRGVTLPFQVCQYCPRHHNHRHLRLLLHRRRDHRSRCAATTCPVLAPNFRSHLCQRILYTILISDMRKSSAMSRTHSELPVCPHCCRVTTSLELVSEVWGVDSALCRAPRQTCDPSQAAHECWRAGPKTANQTSLTLKSREQRLTSDKLEILASGKLSVVSPMSTNITKKRIVMLVHVCRSESTVAAVRVNLTIRHTFRLRKMMINTWMNPVAFRTCVDNRSFNLEDQKRPL